MRVKYSLFPNANHRQNSVFVCIYEIILRAYIDVLLLFLLVL